MPVPLIHPREPLVPVTTQTPLHRPLREWAVQVACGARPRTVDVVMEAEQVVEGEAEGEAEDMLMMVAIPMHVALSLPGMGSGLLSCLPLAKAAA